MPISNFISRLLDKNKHKTVDNQFLDKFNQFSSFEQKLFKKNNNFCKKWEINKEKFFKEGKYPFYDNLDYEFVLSQNNVETEKDNKKRIETITIPKILYNRLIREQQKNIFSKTKKIIQNDKYIYKDITSISKNEIKFVIRNKDIFRKIFINKLIDNKTLEYIFGQKTHTETKLSKFIERIFNKNNISERKNSIFEKQNNIYERKNSIFEKQNNIYEKQNKYSVQERIVLEEKLKFITKHRDTLQTIFDKKIIDNKTLEYILDEKILVKTNKEDSIPEDRREEGEKKNNLKNDDTSLNTDNLIYRDKIAFIIKHKKILQSIFRDKLIDKKTLEYIFNEKIIHNQRLITLLKKIFSRKKISIEPSKIVSTDTILEKKKIDFILQNIGILKYVFHQSLIEDKDYKYIFDEKILDGKVMLKILNDDLIQDIKFYPIFKNIYSRMGLANQQQFVKEIGIKNSNFISKIKDSLINLKNNIFENKNILPSILSNEYLNEYILPANSNSDFNPEQKTATSNNKTSSSIPSLSDKNIDEYVLPNSKSEKEKIIAEEDKTSSSLSKLSDKNEDKADEYVFPFSGAEKEKITSEDKTSFFLPILSILPDSIISSKEKYKEFLEQEYEQLTYSNINKANEENKINRENELNEANEVIKKIQKEEQKKEKEKEEEKKRITEKLNFIEKGQESLIGTLDKEKKDLEKENNEDSYDDILNINIVSNMNYELGTLSQRIFRDLEEEFATKNVRDGIYLY